jgi:adenosylcobinamide-GDP ribazoletransferase
VLGGALGALAGLPLAGVVARESGAALLAAVLGVAALAALSRGLHLDGLADTADGLASRAPADTALQIMRRSDVGPFGVLTLVLVLLVDVAALATVSAAHAWRGLAALTVAAATGRLAVVHAATTGVPSARGSGFGALVAGGTPKWLATVITVPVLAGGAALAVATGANGANAVAWPIAQACALVVAAGLRWQCTRRLGGVTGDVFGALVECATAVTLLGIALAL